MYLERKESCWSVSPHTPLISYYEVTLTLCGSSLVFLGKTLYSHQVYKWVPANLMLGVTLRWTSISSRGGIETVADLEEGPLILGNKKKRKKRKKK